MRWLLCDYAGVLGYDQPPRDRTALVAMSGADESDFWSAYWRFRPAYDLGQVTGEEYWSSVLGGPMTPVLLHRLVAQDVASWLHRNSSVLAAAMRARQRGYRLAILSNAPVELAQALKRKPWLAAFRPCLFSCDLRDVKPALTMYHRALDHLAAASSDVIFFDDRAENVAAASAIGIRAHLFTGASQFDELP
jgi:putative hydrolase of the HAD superfamily